MALKRVFPLTPSERNTPAAPNETGNSIPREGPLPAQVDDTEITVSTIFRVAVYLIIQAQVIDLTGGDVCEAAPTGCKPEAELTLSAAPIAALALSAAPVAALTKTAPPVAALTCRVLN